MKRSRNEKKQLLVRALAVLLALLLLGGILASTLPLFALAEEEAAGNRYRLEMAVDLDAQTIAIREELDYLNATGRALDSVWLNVYANTLRRAEAMPLEENEWNDAFPEGFAPGGVDFISVTVNGERANWAMGGANEQFMRVECALEPGERAVIELAFHLLLTKNNWSLGLGDLGWRLADFFPIAATYDAAVEGFVLNGWTVAIDPLTSDAADFEAVIALPRGWTAMATGTASASGPDADGLVTWTFRAEGARDFGLCFSRKMNERTGVTDSGTLVRACASTGSAAQAMLEDALGAMAFYERWLGAYPLGELTLAETDYLRDGLSKPGLIQISSRLCDLTRRAALETAVARLCAGQWFGGVVGCNPENEPWLSDALSGYAALLRFEDREGYDGYLRRLNAQVLEALQITLPGGLTVDSAASRFSSRGEYELVVVDRGAAVLHETRALMGRERFMAALALFVGRNGGRIASLGDFVAALNEATGSRWDEYVVGQMHGIGEYVNQELTWFE